LLLCEGIVLAVLLGSAAAGDDETADSVRKVPFLFYVQQVIQPGYAAASASDRLAYRYGTLGSCVTQPGESYGAEGKTESVTMGEYMGGAGAGKPFEVCI
jgi:hypothetical protein